VDISMYVVLAGRSKNTAGMQPHNLRRIFRKLRLAVFWRICRLPIGLGSLRARTGAWFPILRRRMSGIASGILATTAGSAPLSPGQTQPYSGPFWAASPSQSDNSGRQPGALATHRTGRAYYIYVASQHAKRGISARNPKRQFCQTNHLQAIGPGRTGTGNRDVGAIAPFRLTA
jgi:hypothetical protein